MCAGPATTHNIYIFFSHEFMTIEGVCSTELFTAKNDISSHSAFLVATVRNWTIGSSMSSVGGRRRTASHKLRDGGGRVVNSTGPTLLVVIASLSQLLLLLSRAWGVFGRMDGVAARFAWSE